ncbi:MAG: hypothetical protein WA621_08595, partial [Candidatus Acidiferrum sp.]
NGLEVRVLPGSPIFVSKFPPNVSIASAALAAKLRPSFATHLDTPPRRALFKNVTIIHESR